MINKEHTQFGEWSVCLGRVPERFEGESQGHPGRPDLISVYFHIDRTECPRDRRDISTGQTGHVHGMVLSLRILLYPKSFPNVYLKNDIGR